MEFFASFHGFKSFISESDQHHSMFLFRILYVSLNVPVTGTIFMRCKFFQISKV